MQIGRKIYYDIATGEIIWDKGEMEGDVIETTFEEDLLIFPNITKDGVLQLPYGMFSEQFSTMKCSINTVTKELIFIPFEPIIIEEPIDEEKVMMAETIIALENRIMELEGGV